MLLIVFEGSLETGLLNQVSGSLRGCGCHVGRWEGSMVSSTPTLQHHLVSVAILGRRRP